MSTTTSEFNGPVFVWVWLPGAADPVVAGRLDRTGETILFGYGQSYLARPNRIPIYLPELPLERGSIRPLVGTVAGCINDAAPDSWGMQVILNRHFGGGREGRDPADLGLLTYLLESGSDRPGALDFQVSSTEYVPRGETGTLDQLACGADLIDAGEPIPEALAEALVNGSSIGGARPKVLLVDGHRSLIAKFSSRTDRYPVVNGEFLAMSLAARCGLSAASVEMAEALGKDVILIERFDRPGGGSRRAMVSALTILGLDELGGRDASYADLAETIRARFSDPRTTLRELFSRITFNILVGNNDDHAKNQSAFWDGTELTLTPAYDVTPAPRAGGETQQVMAIGADGWRYSQLQGCVERAGIYHLSAAQARQIIGHQVATITSLWEEVCDESRLTKVDRDRFWHRQFLNPYAFEGYSS